MNKENVAFDLKFLTGGGEMGELTRKKDWSKTPVGPPESWPQSLRTTLGIILNSKFPMFLWWGPQLTCFYNDAYRPSLGQNGKHPFILGQNAEEAWPEIWTIIKPLIDQVLAGGEATWSEDQLIPIYRNGRLEDVYWTFSYSPVKDETDAVAGVLVTCSETTEKINNAKKILESEKRFRNVVEQAPLGIAIFRGDDFVTEMANETYLRIVDKKESEFIGKPLFDALPEVKDIVQPLLTGVFKTGAPFHASELGVMLNRYGKKELSYFNLVYHPLREDNGDISGIIVVATEVTGSVTAKQKTKENEQKLNIVIEASELGTWELNLETKHVTYSDRYLEIFGYKDNRTFTHDQLLKHLHPDDFHIRNAAFERAFETGIFNYQSRIIWEDKSIHWFESKGKVIYDAENKAVKMIGTIRDITEEKNHRQVLQEREQKFRLLADSMPQFVWTSDAEGNLNYFNKSVYNYSGLSAEQIEKEGWLQIVHPDERDENAKQWRQSISTGEVFIFEHRFKRYDGGYRWQLSRAIPQRDEQGNITMWVGTSTDIQDQKLFTNELEREVAERTRDLKKLNEDLVKSEARYHLMIDEVQDYAIIYLNANGDIENWNKGAEKIKGYKAEEIIGKNFSVFYTEQDQKAHTPLKLLNQARTSGKITHEGWRVKKDGSYFWASIAITAIHDEHGNVIGFSKVTHDLTEKKQASDQLKINAEQLELKNKELEKMNAELQAFAYVSSHDLQEPLRKIQTFATRILDKEYQNLSEHGKDYFSRMQKAANRMQTLIEDLLDYSRTNTAERIFKSTDISEIIADVKNEFKDAITEKKATIEVDISQKVSIIPFQFRQLVHNLTGNALKFSKPDTAPHIVFKGEMVEGRQLNNVAFMPNKHYFHLSVSDNGIGFESQYKDRIFEVFQRLHGKTEYKGTGIGLAIVKKIVENHNGIITANGEVNKGATFDIYIPA
jgi:PAS domain S-box-containing protein